MNTAAPKTNTHGFTQQVQPQQETTTYHRVQSSAVAAKQAPTQRPIVSQVNMSSPFSQTPPVKPTLKTESEHGGIKIPEFLQRNHK